MVGRDTDETEQKWKTNENGETTNSRLRLYMLQISEKEIEKKPQDKNIYGLPYCIGRP